VWQSRAGQRQGLRSTALSWDEEGWVSVVILSLMWCSFICFIILLLSFCFYIFPCLFSVFRCFWDLFFGFFSFSFVRSFSLLLCLFLHLYCPCYGITLGASPVAPSKFISNKLFAITIQSILMHSLVLGESDSECGVRSSRSPTLANVIYFCSLTARCFVNNKSGGAGDICIRLKRK